MSDTGEVVNSVLQAIENIVEPRVNNLKYDKTYRGKITKIVDEGLYKVQINGITYTLPYNGTLQVNDIVRVKSPLNNFSDIYIEPIGGSGGSGSSSNYNDLTNKPILNTTYASSLTASSTEIVRGTINLHKISKTGNYNDLLNKPTLNFIPLTQLGVANGVATLNSSGIVPDGQLPAGIVKDVNYVHTDNNFTNALLTKLNGISAGAQVNILEGVKVNGTALPITDKLVDISVPTKTSDLVNDGDDGIPFISGVPFATPNVAGIIKVGTNLTVLPDGTLNAGFTPVVDNLTSTSTTSALSANQGKFLNDKKLEVDNIIAGTNIILEKDGKTITISSTGGGGGGSKEIEISDTEPTDPSIELWVDLSEDPTPSGGSSIIIDTTLTANATTITVNKQLKAGIYEIFLIGKTETGMAAYMDINNATTPSTLMIYSNIMNTLTDSGDLTTSSNYSSNDEKQRIGVFFSEAETLLSGTMYVGADGRVILRTLYSIATNGRQRNAVHFNYYTTLYSSINRLDFKTENPIIPFLTGTKLMIIKKG